MSPRVSFEENIAGARTFLEGSPVIHMNVGVVRKPSKVGKSGQIVLCDCVTVLCYNSFTAELLGKARQV